MFLLVAFGVAWARQRAAPLLFDVAGAALILNQAVVQHAQLALSPRYFTYDTTYYLWYRRSRAGSCSRPRARRTDLRTRSASIRR